MVEQRSKCFVLKTPISCFTHCQKSSQRLVPIININANIKMKSTYVNRKIIKPFTRLRNLSKSGFVFFFHDSRS